MTHIFKTKQASLINIKNACFHFMRGATSTPSPQNLHIKRVILAIGSYHTIPVEVLSLDKVSYLQ